MITRVAAALPVEVIAELLGVPEPERSLLRGWSSAIVTMYEPEPGSVRRAAAERASAEFVDALRGLAERRRRHPGDDLISDLVTAGVDADELVGTAALLLMAGHEATVNVIGNGVLALLRRPDEWARLPTVPLGPAVEELIRFDPPLQLFERTAVVDVDVAGHRVPAGTRIAALLGAAAHDPQVFDRPTSSTSPATPTRAWVSGRACTTAWAPRWPAWRSAPPSTPCAPAYPACYLAGDPIRRPDFVLRGLRTLPVTT